MLVSDMGITRDHDWQTVDRQRDAERDPQQLWAAWASGARQRCLRPLGRRRRRARMPSIKSAIDKKELSLMINVPSFQENSTDPYLIRRMAIDNHIPLITNANTGHLLLKCLSQEATILADEPKAWQDYVTTGK